MLGTGITLSGLLFLLLHRFNPRVIYGAQCPSLGKGPHFEYYSLSNSLLSACKKFKKKKKKKQCLSKSTIQKAMLEYKNDSESVATQINDPCSCFSCLVRHSYCSDSTVFSFCWLVLWRQHNPFFSLLPSDPDSLALICFITNPEQTRRAPLERGISKHIRFPITWRLITSHISHFTTPGIAFLSCKCIHFYGNHKKSF